MRIKSYVGKLPQPRSFEEGAEILRRLFDAQFPKLDARGLARKRARTFKDENGRLVPTYDVKLARRMDGVDFEQPLPPLWPQFDALRASAADGDPRRQLRPAHGRNGRGDARAAQGDRDVIEVPDQGHAPLLTDAATIGRISEFVHRCERSIH